MRDKITDGTYWDESWNPIRDPENGMWGCAKVSPGCDHCWSEAMNIRFGGAPYDGRKRNFILDEKILTAPIRARKPKVYFVCIMMDLFHQDVPIEFLQRIWEVMACCHNDIFLILTKRPKHFRTFSRGFFNPSNVWLGVTVEHSDYLWRIDELLRIPAAQYWLSLEPLLGAITLPDKFLALGKKGWVVAGGETGRGARPMNAEWVVPIKEKCVEVGIPFYFKGWGTSKENKNGLGKKHPFYRHLLGQQYNEVPT